MPWNRVTDRQAQPYITLILRDVFDVVLVAQALWCRYPMLPAVMHLKSKAVFIHFTASFTHVLMSLVEMDLAFLVGIECFLAFLAPEGIVCYPPSLSTVLPLGIGLKFISRTIGIYLNHYRFFSSCHYFNRSASSTASCRCSRWCSFT